MTINPDLHPDDGQHRRDLVAELRRIRLAADLRHADLAPVLGVQPDAVGRFERRTQPNPQILTVQRHARALGHVADLMLHGVTWPATVDINTYAALATSTNETVADTAARSLCVLRLAAARRRYRLTRSTVAGRLGINADTLYQIEAERQEPLLSTYQRYARALGGRLTVELRPVEALERVEAVA